MVYPCGGQRSQSSLSTFMRVPGSSQVSRLAQQVLSLLSNLTAPPQKILCCLVGLRQKSHCVALAGLELVSGWPGA